MPDDQMPRKTRRDVPYGYTGTTYWTKHVEKMSLSHSAGLYIFPEDPNEPKIDVEVWTERPVDPARGPEPEDEASAPTTESSDAPLIGVRDDPAYIRRMILDARADYLAGGRKTEEQLFISRRHLYRLRDLPGVDLHDWPKGYRR